MLTTYVVDLYYINSGMRKRRLKPKSKFVYRHYTQLLAVCPPEMEKANTRSSLANKQTNKHEPEKC